MDCPKGDIGGLVFGQQKRVFPTSNPCRSFHDNPVLGTMIVFLQTEAGTRLDLNPLDLETRFLVDAVVPTPGAENLAVQEMFVALPGVQFCNDFLTF